MQQNKFFLSAISLVFLYFSLFTGIITINIRGTARAASGDKGVLVHYAIVMLGGLLLYFMFKVGIKRFRFLSAFLLSIGAFCISIPFLPDEMFAQLFLGKPPVLALSMALFLPVSLTLFCQNLPIGREGLAFGILLALNELLWAFVFPLLSLIAPDSANGHAAYIFSTCCLFVGVAGIFLAITIFTVKIDIKPVKPAESKKWRPLLCIFLALLLAATALGFYMGAFLPKMTMPSSFLGIPYFIFIFFLPLVGYFLDTHATKLMLICAPILLCVFISGLLNHAGNISPISLYSFLSLQQILLTLAAYTATAKILKNHVALPVFITLSYSMIMTHFIGSVLHRLVLHIPFGFALVPFALLFGIAFCLWKARCLILNAGLWHQEAALSQKESELAKLAVFATTYNLMAKERDVLLCMINEESREEMAEHLAISLRTLRYHISNLQSKTHTPNEKTLIDHYKSLT